MSTGNCQEPDLEVNGAKRLNGLESSLRGPTAIPPTDRIDHGRRSAR